MEEKKEAVTSFSLGDVQPLQGKIVPVRTVQETQPKEEFGVLRPDRTSIEMKWNLLTLDSFQPMRMSRRLIRSLHRR